MYCSLDMPLYNQKIKYGVCFNIAIKLGIFKQRTLILQLA